MTKFFNPKGQNKSGVWKPKKRRLPRKMKKWIRQMDEKRFKKHQRKYLTPVSIYKHILEFRSHRNYRIGSWYYRQVLKYSK